MSKEIYISSTPHETRLAIVESDELTEIYYERENEYTLAGSIYNGKVTRVLPGMQSSFVDIGLERDAFLYITDFMEEAGETAEFDGASDTQRAPRGESQRNENRGDRGNGRERTSEPERLVERPSSSGYVSERSQEQARATPGSDLAQASEGRTEEFGGRGERNDRGGRGRGRGRRDRGGNNSERTAGLPATGSQHPSGAAGNDEAVGLDQRAVADPEYQEDKLIIPADSDVQTPDGASEAQELGEGAPGADGSRRWRGRRGRRRGRGTGQREGGPEIAGESAAPDEAGSPVSDPESFEEVRSFEIDGSADAAAIVTPPQPVTPVQNTDRAEQAGRRERGERGGRGDRNRSERSQNVPRAPRGFTPSRALYGVDSTPEQDEVKELNAPVDIAASEELHPGALILPGESLSKYRTGGIDAAKSQAAEPALSTSVVLPDHAFKVDPNWDGGAMLPGETLSRYRGGAAPASAGETRSADRSDFRRSESRSGGRRDERPDGPRSDARPRRDNQLESQSRSSGESLPPTPMMVPATVPGADLQSAGPVSGYAYKDQQAEEIHAHQPDFVHATLPEATAEAPHRDSPGHASQAGRDTNALIELIDAAQTPPEPEAANHKAEQHKQEYEPQEASASYRVDPAARSQYRQSAPLADSPAEQEMGEHSTGTIYVSAQVDPASLLDDQHFAPSADLESVAFTGLDPVYAEPVEGAPEPMHPMANANFSHAEDPVETHDVTTIEPSGEMVSDTSSPIAISADQAVGHNAAAGTVLAAEEVFETFEEESELEQPMDQGFAPGAGDLEEDFIEEDDIETTSLHAHANEATDDLEDEHLEGAADLGTMIRDMSLDHITRSSGSVDDEEDDDFEEDTLEEDLQAGEEDKREQQLDQADREDQEQFSDEEADENSSNKVGLNARPEGSLENAGGGYSSANADAERQRRRENGRRGGRGDRSRGGNRDGSHPSADRNGSDPNGSGRYSSDRGGPDRSGLGERARNTGGGGDRERSRSGGGRGGRQSMQSTNLPAISELLKPGQEILCQIAKEPIAKKGARITSHIALPGRFLVFMPTVSHTGVSRKIESDAERRRLKEILLSEKGEAAGGFIVRTAAAGASEEELRSDLRFLLNLWTDIKQRSESSKSPALIYHDLNLVERILRDQVTDNFSAIWVDTETEYERVLRFLQRFQPALIRRVKLYTKETPLFEQFGITEEINKALRSKVWLKSGGSIVINQTEALVAIDINTGKFVGKTARLEDTIVKTNLDAIPEIVRQIRLRDLGGIIIIDFIDMDERKNRNRVMAALEDELKSDRAPSKVLPFNDFGLVAITRKRVKQSLERTLSTTCNVCVGTGMVKSPVTVCNDIYVEMRKMHKHLDRGDVMLRVHPEVVKQLKSTGSRWLQEMEEMAGKTILIKSDPSLHPEQFDIH